MKISTTKTNPSESPNSSSPQSDQGLSKPTILTSLSTPDLSLSSEPVLKIIKLDEGQQRAIDIMEGGKSVFLTGMAGTGKSATLCQFIKKTNRSVEVTATTGIAALNVQLQFKEATGMGLPAYTIYRWSGIGLGPKLGQPYEDYIDFLENKGTKSYLRAKSRIRKCKTLVIDEISMMPGKILDFLDFFFKQVRCNDQSFGGIQIIFTGDFCQLPPVSKTGRYDWAFKCASWNELNPYPIYLKTIHRQDEPDFIEALNAFREGHITQKVADVLASRVSLFTHRNVPRLFTHNTQVDKWNTIMIEDLEGESAIFTAIYTGYDKEWFIKNSITPETLILKVGARVMVTTNISDGGGGCLAVNGQMGTVQSLGDKVEVKVWEDGEGYRSSTAIVPIVLLDNGETLPVLPFVWSMDPQDDYSSTMSQLPLRPAYAISIHKCVYRETLMILDDWKIVSAGSLKVGMKLKIGGEILAVCKTKRPAMIIISENGLSVTCSPEHRWMTNTGLKETSEITQQDSILVASTEPINQYVRVAMVVHLKKTLPMIDIEVPDPHLVAFGPFIGHNSQGLTLAAAHIDIRAAREPGQAYVALSRLKSLSGLHLKDWVQGVHVSNDAINYYKNL